MDNSQKIILDLCGGTGAWSYPYADNGYSVYVVTLPKFDVFDIELTEDELVLVNNVDKLLIKIRLSSIYGIFAAPTCTHFSFARQNAKEPRDLSNAMELVKQCLNIIWHVRLHGENLKFWALENPLGYLRQFLGKPPLTFSPEEYGDHYTKKTDIWGYFNIPPKTPRQLTAQERTLCSFGVTEYPQLPPTYEMPSGWTVRAARRSITSKYFAKAFYKANKV